MLVLSEKAMVVLKEAGAAKLILYPKTLESTLNELRQNIDSHEIHSWEKNEISVLHTIIVMAAIADVRLMYRKGWH